MLKGIVMSIDSEYAYIFTDKCQLIKVALEPDYQIGSEISLPIEQIDVQSKRKTRYLFRTAAVAASLVLVLLTAFFAVRDMRPAAVFATVSVDINPSLNLDIDRNLVVLDSIALDEQTADILAEVELNQLTLQDAIAKWINYLAEEKNIKSEDILIAGVINRQNKNLERQLTLLENDLAEKVRIEEQIRVRVIFSYDKELEERADNNRLSIGRQMIYEYSFVGGFELDINNAAQNRIGQMIDEFVEKGDHDWTNGKKGNTHNSAATISETTSQENISTVTNSGEFNPSDSPANSRQQTQENSNTSNTSNTEPQGTTQRHTEQNQLQPEESDTTAAAQTQQNMTDNLNNKPSES